MRAATCFRFAEVHYVVGHEDSQFSVTSCPFQLWFIVFSATLNLNSRNGNHKTAVLRRMETVTKNHVFGCINWNLLKIGIECGKL